MFTAKQKMATRETQFLRQIKQRAYDNYASSAAIRRVTPDAFFTLGGLGGSGNFFIFVRIDEVVLGGY